MYLLIVTIVTHKILRVAFRKKNTVTNCHLTNGKFHPEKKLGQKTGGQVLH